MISLASLAGFAPASLTLVDEVLGDLLPRSRVPTALDGWRGLDLACQADPDVILLDIVMSGLDGFEVCRRLKSEEALRHIPVVFLTALKTGRKGRIQALDAGGDGFLAKPLDEAELLAQIRAMAKIKRSSAQKRLAALVTSRTRELEQELANRRQAEERLQQANSWLEQSQEATLLLLDELRQEVIARRRDQESLQQSEEKYRGIFETIQDVYFETKIDGTILELSPSVERLIQYTRQELLGTLVQDRYQAPGEREKIFSEMLAKGRINDFEIAFTDKDGRVMPGAITAMVVAGADGQPVKVCGVLRDISQRKAVELAMRASEERFRQTSSRRRWACPSSRPRASGCWSTSACATSWATPERS